MMLGTLSSSFFGNIFSLELSLLRLPSPKLFLAWKTRHLTAAFSLFPAANKMEHCLMLSRRSKQMVFSWPCFLTNWHRKVSAASFTTMPLCLEEIWWPLLHLYFLLLWIWSIKANHNIRLFVKVGEYHVLCLLKKRYISFSLCPFLYHLPPGTNFISPSSFN